MGSTSTNATGERGSPPRPFHRSLQPCLTFLRKYTCCSCKLGPKQERAEGSAFLCSSEDRRGSLVSFSVLPPHTEIFSFEGDALS